MVPNFDFSARPLRSSVSFAVNVFIRFLTAEQGAEVFRRGREENASSVGAECL